MQLTRIQLTQFRKFRDGIDIRDLAPGLNLLTGPNEAGKSTIAAAIRAAFFERHRSRAVEDFRPFEERQASPAVALDFRVDDTDYRLFKQFLGRPRCTLEFGTRRLDGEEAEDYLANLLGYQYASRGRSKADTWGIPGLLWTEQGKAQELDEAIHYALAHLRAALGDAGAQPVEEASQLLVQVTRARGELLSANKAAPSGAYAEAVKRVQALQDALHSTQEEAARYRQAVDRLAGLQAAYQADAAEQPWQALRAQQKAAQDALDDARQNQQRLQGLLQQQKQWQDTATLLQDQLLQLEQEGKTWVLRRTAVADAQMARQQAEASAAQAEQQQQVADTELAQAERVLERCRARDQYASWQQQRTALAEQLQETRTRLVQARNAHQALQAAQARLASLGVEDQGLAQLRQLASERSALALRQQASATRLRFELEADAGLTLDGQPLQGCGERRLTQAATLHLPGTGRVHIEPGGEDLETLRQTQGKLDAEWAALLHTLRAPSLEELETRHLQAQTLRTESAQHEQALRLCAPAGMDALERSMAALAAQQAEIDTHLAAQPVTTRPSASRATPPLPATAQAHAQAQAAHARVEAARGRKQQAQLALGRAQTREESAQIEWRAAAAALDADARRARIEDTQRRLVEARAHSAQLHGQIDAVQAMLKHTRADILAQDVARFERSAQQLEEVHQTRGQELLRLETELQTLGAHGLDERAAALDLELAQAQRRADALARRARALDHLQMHLRAAQARATQTLQQPLQVHLRHYLDLLFPGAAVGLDEQLRPQTLQRGAAHAGERLELLDALSFGAREQLALVGRLACADLLQAADRPTLLILDDALVHTDALRLAQMKRILFDAATRHQILLFSCHEAWWRDLGILPRDVGAFTTRA